MENPIALISKIKEYYPLSKERFYILQKELPLLTDKLNRDAIFFVLNRASFSGSTMSGGMSLGHPRFTLKSIKKLEDFHVENFIVEHSDFKYAIQKHDDCFLYLDPPYLNGQLLYGKNGDMHKNFDHKILFDVIKDRGDWLLSYNDCPEIRSLYKDFTILDLKWKYGMSKNKNSKEIVILSKNYQII